MAMKDKIVYTYPDCEKAFLITDVYKWLATRGLQHFGEEEEVFVENLLTELSTFEDKLK